MSKTNEKCRHNGTWLVAGGYIEWCYECGAIRQMRRVGENAFTNQGQWIRPVGVGGKNPYDWRFDNKKKVKE